MTVESLDASWWGALSSLAFVEIDDLDADGLPDWAIGEPSWGESAGRVVLVSSLDGTKLDEIVLGDAGSELGAALAYDRGRLYVGAPQARDVAGRAVGAVLAFDLAAPEHHVLATFGEHEGVELGRSLAVFDQDGLPWIVAGEPGRAGESGGALVLDAGGAPLARIAGQRKGDRAGARVVVVSTEKATYVALGAPDADGGRGAVLLVRLDTSQATRLTGTGSRDRFGQAMVAYDDDGDGHPELAVGVPGVDAGAGAIALVSLAGDLLRVVSSGVEAGEAGSALSTWQDGTSTRIVVGIPARSELGERAAWVSLGEL